MIATLKQRSSWTSSFLTGLIGWNGFALIAGLVLGYTIPSGMLFLVTSSVAVVQVLILRLGFFVLRLDRSVPAGLLWGAVTGAALMGGAMSVFAPFREHFLVWSLTALYIGLAVGGFLAYFYRDDRRIEAQAQVRGEPVDYGRDAHWLEPFGFGAAVYLTVFLPRSLDLAVTALVVGAISGVLAAGVSHFFLFAKLRTSWLPVLLGVAGGMAQGAFSGLLFRQYGDQLALSYLTLGAIAGVLTYLATALRGRVLARRELESSRAGAPEL